MLLTIVLYIIAVLLLIYVAQSLIRKKGTFSISDALAALGIVVAIILAQRVAAATTPTVATSPTVTSPTFNAFPTPTQTATPAPKPGDVLYEADWSSGMNGWVGTKDWKSVSGMVVNDGTNNFANGVVIAPYQPGSIADYAVETEIQVIRGGCHSDSFGVLVRAPEQGGYLVGARPTEGCGPTAELWMWDDTSLLRRTDVKRRDFSIDTEWHKYRVEVQDNKIRLFVDGGLVLEAIDNRYVDGGKVGMWSLNIPFNVRSFKVIKL